MSINFSYDGGSIGGFLGDAMRKLTASFNVFTPGAVVSGMVTEENVVQKGFATSTTLGSFQLRIVFSNVKSSNPTADENRPGSLSASPCISY